MASKCKNYEYDDYTCMECFRNHVEEHNSCYERNVTKMEKEQVLHPSHYSQDGRRECIEEMKLMFGKENLRMWCVMTAYKYYYRAGNKDGNSADQDRRKAEFYLKYAEGLQND